MHSRTRLHEPYSHQGCGSWARCLDRPDPWSLLMKAAQAGNGSAYRQLLIEVTPFIRVILRHSLRQTELIEDTVQDVLLTIHRVRHTYDPSRSLAAWVAAIAKRRAIDALRREGRKSNSIDISKIAETFADPSAKDQVEAKERADRLRAAIAGLSSKQREALQLVKLEELSLVEGAARSGQSKGALKVNVHRAIRALRVLLRDE